MMSHIYRLARKVRVWIGCDTKGMSDAFQLIPKIMTACSDQEGMEVDKRGQGYRVLRDSVCYFDENLPKSSSYEDFTSDWEDLFSAQDKMDIWDFSSWYRQWH